MLKSQWPYHRVMIFVCLYWLVIVDSWRDIFLRLSLCYLRRKIEVISELAAWADSRGNEKM